MGRLRVQVGIAAVLVVVGAVLLMATAPSVRIAVSLRAFEHEDRATLTRQAGRATERLSLGDLRIDRVSLDAGEERFVHRTGSPRPAYPRATFLVGQHGALYEDESPEPAAWRSAVAPAAAGFTVGAVLLFAGFVVVATAAARRSRALRTASTRGLDRAAEIAFGQRATDARPVNWVPGQGTHGSTGGQVPPYVPYNPDWDPKRRIK